MTNKPLEQILNEFMQHCAEERRREESANFKAALDKLKKSGSELKSLGESLISSTSEKQPAPPELKQIYFILETGSAQRYLNRSEHYEIRNLVRDLISKYPGFIEQHGQELDRKLITRAKNDLDIINTEMHEMKKQATAYGRRALEKNSRSGKIRSAVDSLWIIYRQMHSDLKQELARCDAEVSRGRTCSLSRARFLENRCAEIEKEIKQYQKEAEQIHKDTLTLKHASDRFTEGKESEIGERFILGKLNTDFLMGESYKERLEYLAQPENE